MKRVIWTASVLLLSRCANPASNEAMNSSSVMVDLGDGNADAIAAYNGFDASRCGKATTAVLAFKSFGGQNNVTQAGAEQLIRESQPKEPQPSGGEQTYNDSQDLDDTPPASPNFPATQTAGQSSTDTATDLPDLLLKDDDGGIDVDVVQIDGEATCVVRAPVNLHTPAIARKIAEQGTVKNFYMTGQRADQGYVEQGATNNINTNATFYDANGRANNQRTTSNRIDEDAAHGQTVSSSFDQRGIAKATGIPAADGPREANNYICNATNYVLSQQGSLAYLPGLTFKPLPSDVRTGFVHVPDDSSAADVARVMRQTIMADRAAAAVKGR